MNHYLSHWKDFFIDESCCPLNFVQCVFLLSWSMRSYFIFSVQSVSRSSRTMDSWKVIVGVKIVCRMTILCWFFFLELASLDSHPLDSCLVGECGIGWPLQTLSWDQLTGDSTSSPRIIDLEIVADLVDSKLGVTFVLDSSRSHVFGHKQSAIKASYFALLLDVLKLKCSDCSTQRFSGPSDTTPTPLLPLLDDPS